MAPPNPMMPPEYEPKPLWRRLLNLALFAGIVYGLYWAWQTGELLKAVEWLMSQDITVLAIVAVIALIALILGLRGV